MTEDIGIGDPFDQNAIGLGMAVAGMGQPQREFTLISEQQSPTTISIQSTNRVQT
jgi:hypothetical protein